MAVWRALLWGVLLAGTGYGLGLLAGYAVWG